jgi:hypothetical protein
MLLFNHSFLSIANLAILVSDFVISSHQVPDSKPVFHQSSTLKDLTLAHWKSVSTSRE